MMVRKSRFLLRLLSFHEGPDPRSARASAVETPFFTSGLGSNTVMFFLQFYQIPGTFGIEICPKDIRNRAWKQHPGKSTFFFCSGSVFGSVLPTLWTASSCLWDVMPSKYQGFLETGGLDSQRFVSHDVWGQRVFSHRGLRAIQKTTIQHACRPKPCHLEEGS